MTLRVAELNDSLVDLAHALKPPPGQPKMPLKLYWQMVAEVEAEREELRRRLAVTREASLLVETLAFEDMAEEWEARQGKVGFTFDPERVCVEFVA